MKAFHARFRCRGPKMLGSVLRLVGAIWSRNLKARILLEPRTKAGPKVVVHPRGLIHACLISCHNLRSRTFEVSSRVKDSRFAPLMRFNATAGLVIILFA